MREFETKEVLLDKLIGIQDLEAVKPIHDMDTDLITECTDYIIELTGDELPTESALEQMKLRLLQRLFGRSGALVPPRKRLLRKLLIAAIVVILIVAMAVSMMPLGTHEESLIHRLGLYFIQNDSGQSVDYDDYLSLIGNGEMQEYSSIRQFIRKTRADVLLPTKLPKGVSIQKVCVYFEYISDCPVISLMTNDPTMYSVQINLGKEHDISKNTGKTERINTYECVLYSTPGWCQCDFNYGGNGYLITAKSYEELILILNNMKGSLEK